MEHLQPAPASEQSPDPAPLQKFATQISLFCPQATQNPSPDRCVVRRFLEAGSSAQTHHLLLGFITFISAVHTHLHMGSWDRGS